MRWLVLFATLLGAPVLAQEPPEWFAETFLDIREDAADAAKESKRLMLYFMQDGCPYCKQLVTVNFRDPKIVAKMRRHFVPVAINIWGDREVTAPDGRKMPEKRFAAALKIQFTPTLLFFDAKGAVVHRINGYLPPKEFYAALDGAISAPVDLRRKPGSRPLALLLLAPQCDACDELERNLKRADVLAQLAHFELVRLPNPAEVLTPGGNARLASAYVPSFVFLVDGREVFRTEAYLRAFHIAAALDYVASGSYASEPSFQRYLQARAELMRSRGERVDLWD